MKSVGHLINGAVRHSGDRHLDITNPSTGKIDGKVSLASAEVTTEAIAAAQAVFPEWRATPPARRAQIMFRFKALLESHTDELAALIGSEHGKISHDAAGEVGRGIENVEFACFAPELLKGEYSRNVGPEIDSWSEFQPLGVVAGITPFNFPVMVPLWMYPLAIACGNTFVLKPSEKDPSAAVRVAELAQEAGLPPGVLNVVNGDKEAVDVLLSDPRIQAVSFVGSTPVAESVYRTATANGKRCQALGGAKNHAIVMPDADIDNTVQSLMGAAFGSSGERCMAVSVVVAIGDETADALIEAFRAEMVKLKVGSFDNANNDFGPLISDEHRDRVVSLINSAEKAGASIIVDGRKPELAAGDDGFFVGGTLIDHVKSTMACYQQEIFGPVLSVVRVANLDEAMSLVDDHEYGNGSCLFTRDGEAARYFSDHVKAGMVGINVPLPVPVSYHSFGGWKRSLFGDLSAYGPDGVRFYTRRKTITQRWPSATLREESNFSFPSS
ncbi:MAG: methylmalonate-semialdehyde dehydrogenase (CoA acylating) [Gammaproteobacteria bacterium]|nr:methylmalonate-semialdehyde dehydrogenase (CoA acylating) [Gammaproteobacteria bacterium]MAM80591.1 methylmalonate-semialdehyde dehydrogenase (CoA acylating) [Gammaproteobacteria bacterium]|tara:strand:- start:562 stop:2055 length:1494 start_codon:yes stop_codon:yes gene_type:complete